MPGRGSGRYILPIAKKKGPTDFRTINPLIQQFQQANIIWASCQVGNIDTGTLPPMERPDPVGMTPLPGLTDETSEIIKEARRAEKERMRLLRDKLRTQEGLVNAGYTIAAGLVLTVFVFPALSAGPIYAGSGYVSSAAYTVAAETALASAPVVIPSVGLLPGGAVLAGAVGLAAGANTIPAMTGLPHVNAKPTPIRNPSFHPVQFVTFSKPCGNK